MLDRRQFLAASAAMGPLASAHAAEEPIAFVLVGDTHFLARKDDPAKLDDRSAKVCTGLVDTINTLPGSRIPASAGGGTVKPLRGVIHAGDCIDSGDKPQPQMQASEWAAFNDTWGLTGKDGKLRVPVYEVHGNHDSPRGEGLAIKKIRERNKTRPGVKNVSPNGLHYAWDWGPLRCINLGIVVGEVAEPKRQRRYDPLGSLDFLIADLKANVGTSNRPVVITHHVDMLRYAQPLPVDDSKAKNMEWDPADVKGFHDALKAYHIAAILYGHTHARNVFRWDGSRKPGTEGVPTFNVDNSSHFGSLAQAFFYFEIADGTLTAREYATKDGWATGAWTPHTWSYPVKGMG